MPAKMGITGLLLKSLQIVKERYRIVRLLSRGGEGYVYLAHDLLNNNQICILKQMYFGPEQLSGIEEDYQIFGGLFHPNVVNVLDFFWEEGRTFYVVMNYIPGQTLRTYLKQQKKPINEQTAISWALSLSNTLKFLHTRPVPIFHGDIAPDNIILTPRKELVIIDFGIARVGFDALGVRDGYSAPEQHKGELSSSTEVFSLGATLYNCLTLQEPREGQLDPRDSNQTISPKIANLIKRATAPSKSGVLALLGLLKGRHSNIQEFITELTECYVS